MMWLRNIGRVISKSKGQHLSQAIYLILCAIVNTYDISQREGRIRDKLIAKEH